MLACMRGWLGPGGFRGLQNRWPVVERAAVGSTPIHPRLEGLVTLFLFKLRSRLISSASQFLAPTV